MWKKETESHQPEITAPVTTPAPRHSPPAAEHRAPAASIGPSIVIKGELSGAEDLVIHGQVEGKIDLRQNSITIGKSGRVKADMYGRVISIDGEVEGNLYGGEAVVLRQSGRVRGNIISPRVSLEDGSKFKGSIDMEPKVSEKPQAAPPEVKPRSDVPARATESEARPAVIRPEATAART